MKTLTQYIQESVASKDELQEMKKHRLKVLERWLVGKDYDEYVDTIDIMLKDPQTRKLLIDGFGGEFGTMRFKYSVQEIEAKQLRPTQSELDLDKSLKYALTDIESCKETFDEPLIINKPIITFNKKFVIDGHHTWLQAMALNPHGKMFCFNYDAKITPMQMLKAVQGVIAAVKAENKTKENKLKHSGVGKSDLYKMSKQDVYDYIKRNIKKNCEQYLCEEMRVGKDNLSKVIADNIRMMLKNNLPIDNAPDRKNMPQIWDGGTEDNEQSAEPISAGSAMNKLKNKKVARTIIK